MRNLIAVSLTATGNRDDRSRANLRRIRAAGRPVPRK